MKELSIEEKAKRYDEVIKKLKILHDDWATTQNRAAKEVEEIFSELKESEDEEIKEMLKVAVERTPWMQDKKEKCYEWLEAQGEQKPADKVEPKFEIGDLITNGILVGEIDEIHELGYHAYFEDHYADVPDVENWHKWTIQDAKDGDVLCGYPGSDYPWIGIFCKLNAEGTFSSHCYIEAGLHGKFCPPSKENIFGKRNVDVHSSKDVVPATKEQRDLLFQKMHESGYEWNAEKKELKKIKQNPAWSEEDNINCKRLLYFLDGGHLMHDHNIELSIWLTSLKERYTWKPSELQIEALESATENCAYSEYQDCLRELIGQLKKLREE